MAGKQVEFPPQQSHPKGFELALVVASLVCIVFTVICIQVVGGGGL